MTTNPYTTVSVSGYNANPPDDDGSAVASNEIEWDKHKTKLGDPLNTAVTSIDTNVNAAFEAVAAFVPSGVTFAYAGSSTPTGFLLCDGSAVSRTTYADLFTIIGTIYGVGDGSTTFNVPDITGRVIAGREAVSTRLTNAGSGIDGDSIGDAGGSQTHTLTEAQLAEHDHNLTVSTRDFDTTGINDGDRLSRANDDGTARSDDVGPTVTAGSGQAHPNVQPTIILNYIIKH